MVHFIDLPNEILLYIIDYIDDTETEDAFVVTCKSLKNLILLGKRCNDNLISPAHFRKNAYLFDILQNTFDWLPTSLDIQNRLSILAGDFLQFTTFKHVILAGGSIHSILDTRVSDDDLVKSTTDLDFFLYGTTEHMKEAFLAIAQILAKYNPYYFCRSSLIDVMIPGKRSIQIVFCEGCVHPYDVVSKFDLGYVQAFFDGKSVYARHLALVALMKKTTVSTCLTSNNRIDKAERKGFSVVNKTSYEPLNDSMYVVRSRFLLQCIKKEIDCGNISHDVVRTLQQSVDWADFSITIKAYSGHGSYGHNLDTAQHFGAINLDDGDHITCYLDTKGYHLDKYKLLFSGSPPPFVMTNLLKIAPAFDDDSLNNADKQIVVHESAFSTFVQRFKSYLNRNVEPFNLPNKGFSLLLEEDRHYEDMYLKIKRDKNTEYVDQYMVPYNKQVKTGDSVICEVEFRIYAKEKTFQEIRNLRRQFGPGPVPSVISFWARKFFSIYAKRVIVVNVL